jgi:hypothetical protein
MVRCASLGQQRGHLARVEDEWRAVDIAGLARVQLLRIVERGDCLREAAQRHCKPRSDANAQDPTLLARKLRKK